MELLKDLVRNVVVIILLTTFLDMMMPSGSMQRFVKVVMGLFVLVALLHPMLNLLKHGQDFEVFTWQLESPSLASNTVLAQSDKLSTTNQELFLDNYQKRLEGQMKALVKLVKGVKEVEVQVQLKGGKQLGSVEEIGDVLVIVEEGEEESSLIVMKPVEPIKIGEKQNQSSLNTANSKEKERIEGEIKNTLSNYFGLVPKQIQIVFS